MQDVGKLAVRPLGEVVAAIASADVVPGAGSAGAVGLALAAACAAKAVAVTLKHHSGDAFAQAHAALTDIARRALHGADEDAARFREYMHERDAGSASELLEAGERLHGFGTELMSVIERVSSEVHPSVSGDIHAALALCRAFGAIQSANLQENRAEADAATRD